METPTLSKPVKDKTCQGLAFTLTLALLALDVRVLGSPHLPKQLTWQVISQMRDIIWSITGFHPPGTWWPTLTPDFCSLATGLEFWDMPCQVTSNSPGKEILPRRTI